MGGITGVPGRGSEIGESGKSAGGVEIVAFLTFGNPFFQSKDLILSRLPSGFQGA